MESKPAANARRREAAEGAGVPSPIVPQVLQHLAMPDIFSEVPVAQWCLHALYRNTIGRAACRMAHMLTIMGTPRPLRNDPGNAPHLLGIHGGFACLFTFWYSTFGSMSPTPQLDAHNAKLIIILPEKVLIMHTKEEKELLKRPLLERQADRI